MVTVLSYQEADEIFKTIQDHLDRSDEDIMGLYRDMIAKAVRYAHFRSDWNLLSREQKQDRDESRTMAHDAFIMSLNIVARTQGEIGASWREQLSDDRKRIGDFACYIALFEGIDAR